MWAAGMRTCKGPLIKGCHPWSLRKCRRRAMRPPCLHAHFYHRLCYALCGYVPSIPSYISYVLSAYNLTAAYSFISSFVRQTEIASRRVERS